jgi:hypothetical protein
MTSQASKTIELLFSDTDLIGDAALCVKDEACPAQNHKKTDTTLPVG